MRDDDHWMGLAIDAARSGIASGQSPFGAVIVRGDDLIASAHNVVWKTTDPTAHAEVACIRGACQALGTISLAGCRMYTTCEPCPMCAAAIHWSRLDSVAYGAGIADALRAGFTELDVPCEKLLREGASRVQTRPGLGAQRCAALFDEWLAARGRAY
ncbi:MAG: nucleoside deaminase [Phycisphaeraceae bacterium]|nr:nucleoside deaminase [Phycisphaerae bacterium]MBX3391154.1 nucleoside deaminase [Phycisphaeraceae bacterium]HRJ49604.1 nucleoside deaminase [Phycisphaerales bacterium]